MGLMLLRTSVHVVRIVVQALILAILITWVLDLPVRPVY
jgi:hypothetical protein